MSDNIIGTVIDLKDFLFDVGTRITIKHNGKKYPVLTFEKGRVLTIPDYQREIRWKRETLFSLMNDKFYFQTTYLSDHFNNAE